MNIGALCLIILNLFNGLGLLLFSPLFPEIANKFDIKELFIGIAIGSYSFVIIISSLFSPLLGAKIPKKIMLAIFRTISGLCNLSYSILYFVNDKTLIMVLSLLIRIIHGCTDGIYGSISISTLYDVCSPEEINSYMGWLLAAFHVGCTIGPLFCSIFHMLGGYPLTFWVIGPLSILTNLLLFFVKLNKKEASIQNYGVKEHFKNIFNKLFRINNVMVIIAVIFVSMAYIFSSPSLVNYLTKTFNFTVSQASAFFMIHPLTFVISNHFVNYIINAFGLDLSIVIGLFLAAIGTAFFYISDLVPKVLYSIIILSCIIIGIGYAFINVQTNIKFTENLKEYYPNMDERLVTLYAPEYYILGTYLGDFLGSIAGGALFEKLGAFECSIILGTIIFVFF